MKEILGKAKTVRELLKGVKYQIDYYQREYRWQNKHIRELIDDLSGKFLEEYEAGHERSQVAEYPHYFLGSIIISQKDNANYIVDGQQRLTSVTLLLIYLRNLQRDRPEELQVNVDELIFSEKYGQKSFNLQVDERIPCMEALFRGEKPELNGQPPSVRNIVQRYGDIEECLPDEIREEALPYFVDWLLENVHLVQITAYSDEDAYIIFETMNDRGLSLTPTEMLKGYLLSNVADAAKRTAADKQWRGRIRQLNEAGKEVEPDSIKAWLRSQYADTIRERKRGATPEDFDRLGTEFHRWVRGNAKAIGLESSDDFYRFITRDFEFYSRQYLRLVEASRKALPGLEPVFYNAGHSFTLQYMLLLAPLIVGEEDDVVRLKLRLVGRFVDILLARRLWNFHSIAYSTMHYAMFLVMRDIRGLAPQPLAAKLHETLAKEQETFANDRLRVHQQNRYALHRLLARITAYVEERSGVGGRYVEYVNGTGGHYEVEHIWADKFEQHTDEFAHPADFEEYRSRIGGVVLLPKSFNASYGDLPYEEKLPHYLSQNLLARSLHPQCYDHNPGFTQFVARSGLPFQPHAHFEKADIDARGALYREVAERIWDPDELLREVGL